MHRKLQSLTVRLAAGFLGLGFLLAPALQAASPDIGFRENISGKNTPTDTPETPTPSLPRRTVLLVIDGLVAGAIERLPLTQIETLKTEGVYYRELVLPLAAHPRFSPADENDPLYYPWSCSIPNPIMMTGTLFIGQPGIKDTLLQHSYTRAGKQTAFLVDSDAYTEIAPGYDTYRADWKSDDDSPVFPAVQAVIEEKNPHFIRIHLQSTGAGGYLDRRAGRTIWDENAEYRRRAIKADALIGDFVRWLKEHHHWEETVLLICGDHGQADGGGHAPYEPGGDRTSLLVLGKGINAGATFPYAEMTDLAPTIAWLQAVPVPRYSQGRVLLEAFQRTGSPPPAMRNQEALNALMLRFHALLKAQPALAEHPQAREFLVIEQIGGWHRRFSDLPALLAHQRQTLETLETHARRVP
jgi:hypothetical protein